MTHRAASVFVVLLCASRAHADGARLDGMVRLSGMFLIEHQAEPWQKNLSSPYDLLYGDLRLVLDGTQLHGVDLHLDARVRATGDFDNAAAWLGQRQYVSRAGYGGREYELRQAWATVHRGAVDVSLGRLVIAESDALRIDGARLAWRFADRWNLSLFGGGFPDPYSRSVLTDYVAHTLPFAGGLSLAYQSESAWGSMSAAASSLGPNNEPRIYLTLTGWERATRWLTLFHDLVVDVGPHYVDLTRLDLHAAVELRRFSLRVGYDRMAAIAIDQYLQRLLTSMPTFGYVGTIENNLIVQRTARDQARGELEVRFGKITAFADGRFRKRALVGPVDPRFVEQGTAIAPGLAGDLTLGVRDSGSGAGVRWAAAATYVADYRTTSWLATAALGRSFAGDRVELDLDFVYAHGRDDLVGVPCDASAGSALLTCFGARAGDEYELGFVAGFRPFTGGHLGIDYRLVVDATNGARAIFEHVLLASFEARFQRGGRRR
jgi:hypothetical protein